MPHERYWAGDDDHSYEDWHRLDSINRFIKDNAKAAALTMVDIDTGIFVECLGKKEPIAYIERAIDTGQTVKYAGMTRETARYCSLGKKSTVYGFIVLVTRSDKPNPFSARSMDIERFRVMQIWPEKQVWKGIVPNQWITMTPDEFASFQCAIRKQVEKERKKFT